MKLVIKWKRQLEKTLKTEYVKTCLFYILEIPANIPIYIIYMYRPIQITFISTCIKVLF